MQKMRSKVVQVVHPKDLLTVPSASNPSGYKDGQSFRILPQNFEILEFVLKCLRLLGLAPFGYTEKEVGGGFRYSCGDWSSFHITQSLAAAVLAIFGWSVFLTHHGFQKFLIFPPGFVVITLHILHNSTFVVFHFPVQHLRFFLLLRRIRHTFTLIEDSLRRNNSIGSYKIDANLGMFKLMIVVISTQQVACILLSWLNGQKLVHLMNDWASLNEQTQKELSVTTGAATKLKSPRHAYFTHYHIAVGIGVAYVMVPPVFATAFFLISCPPHAHAILEVSFLSIIASYLGLSETLQDVKVVLMLNQLAINFRQVRFTTRSFNVNLRRLLVT